MSTLEAIEVIEGEGRADWNEQIEAWQTLLDSGIVWQLQGYYGRTAANLISQGVIVDHRSTRK